jgi:hypothetical protein
MKAELMTVKDVCRGRKHEQHHDRFPAWTSLRNQEEQLTVDFTYLSP